MKPIVLLATVAVAYTLFSSPLYAKTFAMVIGINHYQTGGNLKGAVNDVDDITEALRKSGVTDILPLTNEKASKTAIYQRWKDMVARSRFGDTLVVTYAGHGGQIKDQNDDEEDYEDEAFLLTHYQQLRADAKDHMILDDEWHRWFASAEGRQVIFVADACHSGTISRGFSRLFPSRIQPIHHQPAVIVEAAKQPVIPHKKRDHVITFSATTEDSEVKEALINGKMRGILSWAFANALRGHGDTNHNGVLEKQELEHYIYTQVQQQKKSQKPQFRPRGFDNKRLLTLANAPSAVALATSLSSLGGDNVEYVVTNHRYSYLTLYNITQNGTIQFLYPSQPDDGNGQITNSFRLPLTVDRNFTGKETTFTIVSEQPQTQLHQRLKQLNGKRAGKQLEQEQPTLLKGKHDIKKIHQQLAG